MYTSPLVLPFAMKRGWFTPEGGILISKFIVGLCLIGLVSVVSRTIGRISNPSYATFLQILSTAQKEYNSKSKASLEKYDFHFSAWPVDFDVRDIEVIKSRVELSKPFQGSIFSPTDLLAKLLTNTFGMSLVYPGSLSLMGMILETPLLEGRSKLILEFKGTRNKIRTRDNNCIDTMFINQSAKENGRTLVICCEGNGGFYELGVMSTPIAAGYSTLGWNHPGFAGSTGSPFPEQERNAVDAVMQFAIHSLGFKPENIIILGWSIGGYTSTWVAMNYPDIQGLILDATFDDLEPLAIPRMPNFMAGIVKHAVNNYINLNIGEQLCNYPGPVTIVRRLRDEMITTSMLELDTNRGNHLLMKMLENRYPNLCSSDSKSSLYSVLSQPILSFQVDLDQQDKIYHDYVKDTSPSFPCSIGKDMTDHERILMLLFLTRRYMKDLDSSHCTPLPVSLFSTPWSPFNQFQQGTDSNL